MKNKNRVKAWAMTNGVNTIASTKKAYWNPQDSRPCEIVFNGGWIHVSERRPTKRDADKEGYVAGWCEDTGYYEFKLEEIEMHDPLWWQSCLKAPKKGRK